MVVVYLQSLLRNFPTNGAFTLLVCTHFFVGLQRDAVMGQQVGIFLDSLAFFWVVLCPFFRTSAPFRRVFGIGCFPRRCHAFPAMVSQAVWIVFILGECLQGFGLITFCAHFHFIRISVPKTENVKPRSRAAANTARRSASGPRGTPPSATSPTTGLRCCRGLFAGRPSVWTNRKTASP